MKHVKSDVSSRITRADKSKVQTAPVARKTKEEAAEDLAKQILVASDKLTVNITKSGKGKCIVMEFGGCENISKLTALVFNGSGITLIAEQDPKLEIFNVSKRNFDSVENASKFVRCAFVKNKTSVALKVPVKESKRDSSNQ